MVIKTYWSICGLFALVVFLLFATGNLTMLSVVVLGFVAFGLTFMGMMGVLLIMVSQPIVTKPAKVRPPVTAKTESPMKGFHIFKSA